MAIRGSFLLHPFSVPHFLVLPRPRVMQELCVQDLTGHGVYGLLFGLLRPLKHPLLAVEEVMCVESGDDLSGLRVLLDAPTPEAGIAGRGPLAVADVAVLEPLDYIYARRGPVRVGTSVLPVTRRALEDEDHASPKRCVCCGSLGFFM